MKTYIAQLSMGHDQMRFEGLDKSDKVHSLESAILFYMWIYRAWVQLRYSNPELCNNSTLRSVPKQLNQISDR